MGNLDATIGIIGAFVGIIALVATLVMNYRAVRRDNKKEFTDEIGKVETRTNEQIKRAHERMTEIETNYNKKFEGVNTNVNEKNREQMAVLQQIVTTQQSMATQLLEARSETAEVRINLKSMMEHNNIKYQE